ncbi:hypothetical protein WMY93_009174 [Mugilogobius chulae]|uniref:Uncharacterized protein n=1 Tax=Mugilogobius chulae TaxID=88201 RepID=A0AAW0PFX8_9GOBI
MAAGATGAVLALLLYSLFMNFFKSDHVVPGWHFGYNTKISETVSQRDYAHASFYKQTQIRTIFGYGNYALAVSLLYRSTYKRILKRAKPSTRQPINKTLLITICLMLSGDIHPCPGPHHAKSPELATIAAKPGGATRDIPILQVCSFGQMLPCCVPNANLLSHNPWHIAAPEIAVHEKTDAAEGVGAAAVSGPAVNQATSGGGGGGRADQWCEPNPSVAAYAARDSTVERSKQRISSTILNERQAKISTRQTGKTPQPASGAAPLFDSPLITNRKHINPGIRKHRKWALFRTVNHSRIIWDSKAKPKGLLGGHLNVRSIIPKTDQITHLLENSNLDFLGISETWLHDNAPSAALKTLDITFLGKIDRAPEEEG